MEANSTSSVLIYDNQHLSAECARSRAEKAGYDVQTSRQPADLLQAIETALPNLLLAHVNMEESDGCDVADLLSRSGARVELLPITNYESSVYRAYGLVSHRRSMTIPSIDVATLLRQIDLALAPAPDISKSKVLMRLRMLRAKNGCED